MMKDFLTKNWINALGLGMIFTAFIYFLNLASEKYEIPSELKIALSFILGSGLILFGIKRFQKGLNTLAQITSGLGTAIILATIAFISFSETIGWSNGTLVTTLGITVLISTYISDRYNMQILAIISTLGGLITPFFIQASESHDFTLFLYLLIINISTLIISIRKDWVVLRYSSFLLSICLYAVYYYLFDPISWTKPFFYASALFTVYAIGFIMACWKKAKSFDGIDIYLSIINSVNFVFWCHFILGRFDLPCIIPIIIVGIVFIGFSLMIYTYSKEKSSIGAVIYFILGILSITISGSEMASHHIQGGINHLVIAFMWLLILTFIYMIIRLIGQSKMILVVFTGYLLLTIYWYSCAWDVEWIPLLGVKYIPFINLGAIVWISLALFGFSLSRYLLKETVKSDIAPILGALLIKRVSSGVALVAHLVIGGLLTVQIMNLWEAYDISLVTRGLMVSLMWFIYALTLFLWSNSTKQTLFKILGGTVVIISTLKVFVFDLRGESTLEKIIFLLLFGGILFIVGKVNKNSRKNLSFCFPSDPTDESSADSDTSSDNSSGQENNSTWKKF